MCWREGKTDRKVSNHRASCICFEFTHKLEKKEVIRGVAFNVKNVVAVAGLKGTEAEAEGVYVLNHGTGPIRENELDESSCS